jgi:Na+-driven multidrug efflux pump
MRLVAGGYVIWSFAFGAGIALRVVQQTRRLWTARLLVSLFSLAGAFILVKRFGLNGAGWTAVLTAVVGVVAVSRVWVRARERIGQQGEAPVPPTVVPAP